MSESDATSRMAPLEKSLFAYIDEVFNTANETATWWGYSNKNGRVIAEHYTEDGEIDARYEVHVTISRDAAGSAAQAGASEHVHRNRQAAEPIVIPMPRSAVTNLYRAPRLILDEDEKATE